MFYYVFQKSSFKKIQRNHLNKMFIIQKGHAVILL